MSIRLEMLQVARLATKLLEESSSLVETFVRSRQNADGGFAGRDGKSDLYYTSFAIDALTALQVELPVEGLRNYLESFQAGGDLDFVHLCCLARTWSALEKNHACIDEVLAHIDSKYRSADGGYNQTAQAETGSAYGSFLAYGAHSDHGRTLPNIDALKASLAALMDEGEGAWANDRDLPVLNVPATAAAVTLYRNLRLPIPESTAKWILGCLHSQGGFCPFPGAPMPDLLSTAVALHCLDGLQVPIASIQDPCLDFVDSLWTAEGGFHGTWDDEMLDIEYTYYGLLALGHLSL